MTKAETIELLALLDDARAVVRAEFFGARCTFLGGQVVALYLIGDHK